MATQTLVAPATAASTTILPTGSFRSVVIMASNITAAETVDVYIHSPDGDDLLLASCDGRTNAIDATNGAVELPGGPDYTIVKSVTAGASGIFYAAVNNNG